MKINIPQLSVEAAAAFEEYLKASDAKRKADGRAKKQDERRKAALSAVTAEMNGSSLALLPDGRIVQRITETRNWPALPAKTVEWERLQEAMLG